MSEHADQPDAPTGPPQAAERLPSSEWGGAFTSLPEAWRSRLAGLAALAFWKDHHYRGILWVAERWMLDLGLAVKDARTALPAADFDRWIGSIEVNATTIATAEEIEGMAAGVQRGEWPVPLPVRDVRAMGVRAETLWAEAVEALREQFAAVARFGSAISELGAEIDGGRMAGVLDALRLGATPSVLDEALAAVRQYGDAAGVVSEAKIAEVLAEGRG
jgi:hypothetical protein